MTGPGRNNNEIGGGEGRERGENLRGNRNVGLPSPTKCSPSQSWE